jgi:hypothetical protein
MNWKVARVAFGMSQRPDLVLAAAAAGLDDEESLKKFGNQAAEHALVSASATTGTAEHRLTERIDRGETLGVIPAEYKSDLDAYRRATEDIEWLAIESFRVHDEFKVAGTTDRIGRDKKGRIRIYDIKTGNINFPHKMCMQLAMYSRSVPYDIATDKRVKDPGEIDKHRGVIIHLPAGEGRCDLYEVDIVSGWGACLIARQVWRWRDTKGLLTPLKEPVPPPTWESLANAATTVEELRTIWAQTHRSKQLTKSLRALCTECSQELSPTAHIEKDD